MRKELSITTEPFLTSYSYHAFPQCIMMAEDRIGEKIAEFSIVTKESEILEWKTIGNVRKEEENWIVGSADEFGRNNNACIYRKINEPNDFIDVQIKFQQYSGSWGAINLFITDDEANILFGDNEYLCRFGNFMYDGVHLYIEGKEQYTGMNQFIAPYDLVLSRTANKIEVFGGRQKIKKIGEKNLPLSEKKQLYIGIQVRHENNAFYTWFFSNFIQLSCDITHIHRRLDYVALSKHWDFELTNYFLDVNHFTCSEIAGFGGVKYIKECINRGKYVELKLDQYYLKGRDEYLIGHHLHQNLIYGYDDKEHSFLLIGFHNAGKIARFHISYRDLKKCLQRAEKERVKVMTYVQDGHIYSFRHLYVKKMIEAYINSSDSSYDVWNLFPQEDRKYGLSVYKELASDDGMKVLLSDRRISYVLWEHKHIMKKRIKYLMGYGVFSEEQGKQLLEAAGGIEDTTYSLRNMIHKYQIRPEKTDIELLRKWLIQLEDDERHFLENVLKYWEG